MLDVPAPPVIVKRLTRKLRTLCSQKSFQANISLPICKNKHEQNINTNEGPHPPSLKKRTKFEQKFQLSQSCDKLQARVALGAELWSYQPKDESQPLQ